MLLNCNIDKPLNVFQKEGYKFVNEDSLNMQKHWISRVNRLQDIERQKMNASGINNWSIILLIIGSGGLGSYLIPRASEIASNLFFITFWFAIIMNLLLAIFDVLNTYRQNKIIQFRLNPNVIEEKFFGIITMHEMIMYSPLLAANLYLLIYHSWHWTIAVSMVCFVWRILSALFSLGFIWLIRNNRPLLQQIKEKAQQRKGSTKKSLKISTGTISNCSDPSFLRC